MSCSSCGTWNPDDAERCRNCGRALRETPPTSQLPEPSRSPQPASAEAELAYYRTLVRDLPVGTYIVALDSIGTPLYVSPHIPRLVGYSPEEWTAGPSLFLQQLHPDDRERVLAAVAHSKASAEPFSAEYRLLTRDGRVLWIRDQAVVVLDETGRPQYLQGVWEDITERKQAEEALHESQARMRLLLEQLPAIVWTTDRDLRFTSSIGAGLAVLNLRPNEVVGLSLLEFFETDDAEFPAIAAHRRALQGDSVSFEITWKERVFHSHVEPLRGPDGAIHGCIGVALDITDRKRLEQTIAQSEERFRGIFEQAAVGITHATLDGQWLLVNQKFCDIVGYSSDELVGRSFRDITHPDDLPGNLEWESRLFAGEVPSYSLEKRYIRKDGSCIWVHLTLALARGAAGEPLYRVAVVEDISERRAMVASLLQSAQYFAKTFHDSNAAMSISRATDGRYVEVNTGFLCLIGYHREEVIGHTAMELQLWADPEEYGKLVQKLDEGQSLHNVELAFRTKADAIRIGSISLELIEFGGEQCILATIYDVTEQRRVEEAEREAKRLEGRLEGIVLAAREIGHLLNNDLQMPVSTLELLDSEVKMSPDLRAFLDRAKADLLAATQHLIQLQRVVRVETKDTPIGPTLDLERSTRQDDTP